MQYLRYVSLRESEKAYSVFKADNKIAELLIHGDTRTITAQTGRKLQVTERRAIEAFRTLGR